MGQSGSRLLHCTVVDVHRASPPVVHWACAKSTRIHLVEVVSYEAIGKSCGVVDVPSEPLIT